MPPVKDSKNILYQSSVYSEGNVTIGDSITNITVEKPIFSDLDFESYEEESFVAPRFSGKIVSQINAMRMGKLAVITGFFGFDKTNFTKHIAYKLYENFITSGKSIVVKEYQLGSDHYSVSNVIRQEKGNIIFILNNITPKDVNHNLNELRQAVQRSNGDEVIVLVNTNLPFKAWPGADQDYWFTVEADGLQFKGVLDAGLYNKVDLLKYLSNVTRSRGFIQEHRDALKETIEKVTPTDIKMPEQINLLLDLFQKNKTKEDKVILEMVQKTKKKEALVNQWFNALDEDKKLIALGMTLLDGLGDNQFFSLMQRFVHQAWKGYTEGLNTLDYADMTPLMHFFNFSGSEQPIIESKFQNQRYQTLRFVWDTHRRRVCAVLPIIVSIVNESVSGDFHDWDLFATYEKRVRLREVLSDALSDIGRLSPDSIEYTMLQLASHDNIGVQIVAARALAGWCESYEDPNDGKMSNQKENLLDLLDNWHSDTRFQSLIKLFRKNKDSQNSSTTYLRATISLTLGYASIYDEPNRLSVRQIDLLRNLLREKNELVVERNAQTLRLLLRHHTKQIGEKLFELNGVTDPLFPASSNSEQFSWYIANGLSDAQSDAPDAVEEILHDWIHYIKTKRPQKAHTSGALDYREKIIVVLCFTLYKIDYKRSKKINLEQAADALFELRSHEYHPYVRSLLLDVVLNLYERYFDQMEARHSNSIPKIDIDKEVKPIAQALQKRYLQERSEQSGGDYWWKIGDQYIDIWINFNDRPLTDIENVLYKWVSKSNNKSIIMIAAQSIIDISIVDSIERGHLAELLDKIKNKKKGNTVDLLPTYRDKPNTGMWLEITNWLTGNRDQRKILIEGIVKENKDNKHMTEPAVKIFRERLKTKLTL